MELWCEDEARLGLKPVARRVRALKGHRPASSGRHRFESLCVYGFARPATGRNLCLLLPQANAALMGEALAAFARWADPELTGGGLRPEHEKGRARLVPPVC